MSLYCMALAKPRRQSRVNVPCFSLALSFLFQFSPHLSPRNSHSLRSISRDRKFRIFRPALRNIFPFPRRAELDIRAGDTRACQRPERTRSRALGVLVVIQRVVPRDASCHRANVPLRKGFRVTEKRTRSLAGIRAEKGSPMIYPATRIPDGPA